MRDNKYKYGPPDSPLFLKINGKCDVLFTSEEETRFVNEYRMEKAKAYHAKHGEYPPTEMQFDLFDEAREIYQRRVAMKQSLSSTPAQR